MLTWRQAEPPMRRQQDIVKLRQRGCKDCIVSLRFNRKYIDGGTAGGGFVRAHVIRYPPPCRARH